MADLITLSDWQTQRNLPNAANAQESLIISECSARIEEFCGRTFARAPYTEILSGNGTQFLWLRNRPLTATGLAVYADDGAYFGQAAGAFDPVATVLTIGVDYALPPDQPDGLTSRSGLLVRLNGLWYQPPTTPLLVINGVNVAGIGNVKVTYTAGFAAVPLDVQQACMFLCATVKQMARLGQQMQAETDETYSYTLRPLVNKAFGGLPTEVLGILARYRNLAV